MKIINSILKVVLFILSILAIILGLAFTFIEGRLLFSLDWIIYDNPFLGCITYLIRLLFALLAIAIGIIQIINHFKKDNSIRLLLVGLSGGYLFFSLILSIMYTNYLEYIFFLSLVIFLLNFFIYKIERNKVL